MIFNYILAEKDRVARALRKITIHRPMQGYAVRVIHPILPTLRRKHGMFDRKHKIAARHKAASHIGANVVK